LGVGSGNRKGKSLDPFRERTGFGMTAAAEVSRVIYLRVSFAVYGREVKGFLKRFNSGIPQRLNPFDGEQLMLELKLRPGAKHKGQE
jgi:hypothetical protein